MIQTTCYQTARRQWLGYWRRFYTRHGWTVTATDTRMKAVKNHLCVIVILKDKTI